MFPCFSFLNKGVEMPQDLYELLWLFCIYAFFGWCVEVAYHAINCGKFINRGFLNGPYCPIYGIGMIIVVQFLFPLRENLIILFLGSLLLTSLLEFITGFLLEKIFHNKWWDYSNLPFNIKGYVCLKFSIYWGLAGTFVIDLVHPVIYNFVSWIHKLPGTILLIVFMLTFVTDSVITVMTILKFNKHIRILDETARKIHNFSDEIGENIFENVEKSLEAKEMIENKANDIKNMLTENAIERKNEYEELQKKYRELLDKKSVGFRRLVKAFPKMTSNVRNEALQKYIQQIKNIKNYKK